MFELTLDGQALKISSSGDGKSIVIADRNGNLNFVNQNGDIVWKKEMKEGLCCVNITEKGDRIFFGGKDCRMTALNSNGNLEWEREIGKTIWSINTDPEGNYIAVGTGDSIGLYSSNGDKIWEYETDRAMIGISMSRGAEKIVACGDEFLFLVDRMGNLIFKQQKEDSLWDVDINEIGNKIYLGGWDKKIYCLNENGEPIWNYQTGGYIRSIESLKDGKIIAGSHDKNAYLISDNGELIKKNEFTNEVVCVAAARDANSLFAGNGGSVVFLDNNTNVESRINEYERDVGYNSVNETVKEPDVEPMFNFGIFDGPIPDTTEYESYGDSGISESTTMGTTTLKEEGGEFSQFIADVGKEDVRTYLRLGHACWNEGRLERAKEHYQKATEINPKEPRGWHNLSVCEYYISLKANPNDYEGAIKKSYKTLEKSRMSDYSQAGKTLKILADILDAETELDE